MKRAGFAAIPLTAIIMAACSFLPSVFFSRFVSIGPDGMPTDWQYVFSPTDSLDSAALSSNVDVILALRYSPDCKVRHITLSVEEISLESEQPDTVEVSFDLFSSKGRPLGRGVYGIYEITDTIRRDAPLPQGYVISVSSRLPRGVTAGIKQLGVVVAQPPEKQITLFKQ